jgi:hypothetical protein
MVSTPARPLYVSHESQAIGGRRSTECGPVPPHPPKRGWFARIEAKGSGESAVNVFSPILRNRSQPRRRRSPTAAGLVVGERAHRFSQTRSGVTPAA